MTCCLLFKLLLESLQIVSVDVRHGPIREVAVGPMDQVITLPRRRCLPFAIRRCYWPNKQINEMLAPLVNQSCCRVVIEVIEAPANQGKALTGKIHDRGGKIEF